MIVAFLFAMSLLQDDFSAWVDQLGNESLSVREEANRRLIALGPDAVARLEKARNDAKSPEVRARLESIVAHIKKMAELVKAFGPTRRVTVASRGQLLKEVLAPLKAPFISMIDTGDLDEEGRVDVQVRDASWWEALDRVVRAAGARYRLEDEENGKVRITLTKGKEREWPVIYANQFRISVKEASRVESRSLGEGGNWAMVMVELRYQPDLKPQSGWDGGVRVLSIVDAKGVNVKEDRPEWATLNPNYGGGVFSFLSENWVRSNAVLPLTVNGTTHVAFPSKSWPVELDLEGEKNKKRAAPAILQVVKVDIQKDEIRVRVRAEAEGVADLTERITDGGIALIDSEGRRHRGQIHSRGREDGAAEWEIVFTGGIHMPKRISLPWIEELHTVEIPFRLEGVRLPDLTSK